MNPIAYLLISLELTSVMLAVIFLIAWRNFGRHPHALIWSIAFAVASLQWILNLTARTAIDYSTYWLIVSATSIITVSLALAGHRQRAGLPNRLIWYLVPGALVEAAIAYFTLWHPHVGLRAAIGPAYSALTLGLCVPIVLRYRPKTLPAEWGLAIVTGVFAACEFAAAVAILAGGAEGDPAATQNYLAINFLSLPAAYIGMGLFTVLILASDMSEATKQLAIMDQLTGLLNRRGFSEAAERCFATMLRTGSPLSVVIADLDRFKSINDRFGHAAGDEALRTFAQCLREGARGSDVIGRIGGEEFVLLLPGTTRREAAEIAERLRTDAAALTIRSDEFAFDMRASFGVAGLGEEDNDVESLLRRADAALYQSKELGRNRVTVTPDVAASAESPRDVVT